MFYLIYHEIYMWTVEVDSNLNVYVFTART